MLSDDETAILNRLRGKLSNCQRELKRLDLYYNGAQRLEQIGLAVPPELQRFVTLVNWPRVVVNALEERIDLEGFRLPDQPEADDELWRIWQANDLDEESQLAHVDALVYSRSYICVGTNEEDENTPLVTVESPEEMTVELDPRTRRELNGFREYKRTADRSASATLYLPDVTIHMDTVKGRLVDVDRDEHGLGRPPVVQLANRPRTKARHGISEMSDAITLTDAAMRALTNAQIATEILAVPQRYVLGASKGDFVDQDGKQVTAWETYLGAFLALANKDAKIGQMPGADLSNFTRINDHYSQLLAGTYGLPLRYFGQATTNPPSADGIRADESRLVKRAERFERSAGGSWERMARIVRRFVDGDWDPSLTQMETLWRDPATPTKAQSADAAVKLHAEGILPLEAVWEELGYSAVRRQKLREQFDAERKDPLLSLLKAPAPAVPPVPTPAPVPEVPASALLG